MAAVDQVEGRGGLCVPDLVLGACLITTPESRLETEAKRRQHQGSVEPFWLQNSRSVLSKIVFK